MRPLQIRVANKNYLPPTQTQVKHTKDTVGHMGVLVTGVATARIKRLGIKTKQPLRTGWVAATKIVSQMHRGDS
jgi:hypothetical protein